MKLKSFGCSLIFGTDLHDAGRANPWPTPSQYSWPALLAKNLSYEYECHARPGSGNLQIWERLINALTIDEPAIYVIGWTWIDRFDYIRPDSPCWYGNGARWNTIHPADIDNIATTYYRDLHSEHRDKLVSLQCIKSAIDLIKARGHRFIMTYLDDLVLDQRWNNSPGMIPIQNELQKYLSLFDGKNFINYSIACGHKISKTMHPLEEAHKDAANLILRNFDSYIKH